MELLIAILMNLGIFATPDLLTNDEFVSRNQSAIDTANEIADHSAYEMNERGGIVITGGIGG